MGLSQHGDLVSDILATPPCKAPSKGAVGEPSPADQPNDRPGQLQEQPDAAWAIYAHAKKSCKWN